MPLGLPLSYLKIQKYLAEIHYFYFCFTIYSSTYTRFDPYINEYKGIVKPLATVLV